MSELNHEQKQELRHKVRGMLATRHPNAFAEPAIRNRARKELDFDFDAEAVTAALEFLHGLGQVARLNDDLGAGLYWQATPTGVLAHERE